MLAESQKGHVLNCFNQASVFYWGELWNNWLEEGTGEHSQNDYTYGHPWLCDTTVGEKQTS